MRNQSKVIDLSSLIELNKEGIEEGLKLIYDLRLKVARSNDIVELLDLLVNLFMESCKTDSVVTAGLISNRIKEVFNGSI